jgi:hypothetical protein
MPGYTYFYTVTVYSNEHLACAKRLAALAAVPPEGRDARLLGGAALVFAVTHLSYVVHTLLVDALLKKEGSTHGTTLDAQREIAGLGLPSRLDMLPKTLGLLLQRSRPRPQRLLSAVRLRNRLVHPEGVALAGSVDDLNGLTHDIARKSKSSKTLKQELRTADGDVVVAIPLPVGSWSLVKDRTALEAIEDVETYLDDLHRLSEHPSATSEFFTVNATVHH